MPKTRVLVTGGGGPAAIAFMSALGNTGADLFVADIDAHAAGLYLVGPDRRFLVPPGASASFVDTLLALCRRERVDVLVPTVDCELTPVADAEARFAAIGVRLLLARPGTLRLCLDKWALVQACAPLVRVPRSALLDARFTAAGWDFPVIVKPRTGSGSRGVRVVQSAAALAALPTDAGLLVQEYLPGAEYSVDVLADPVDGEIVAAVPRERMKVDSGIAVTSRTVADADLIAAARRVAARVGLTFVGNIQFKRTASGEPALLEVNPRFPGTMPLTVAAGIDMPKLALAAVLGERLSGRTFTFRELAVVRTWQDHFFEPSELLTMVSAEAAA